MTSIPPSESIPPGPHSGREPKGKGKENIAASNEQRLQAVGVRSALGGSLKGKNAKQIADAIAANVREVQDIVIKSLMDPVVVGLAGAIAAEVEQAIAEVKRRRKPRSSGEGENVDELV